MTPKKTSKTAPEKRIFQTGVILEAQYAGEIFIGKLIEEDTFGFCIHGFGDKLDIEVRYLPKSQTAIRKSHDILDAFIIGMTDKDEVCWDEYFIENICPKIYHILSLFCKNDFILDRYFDRVLYELTSIPDRYEIKDDKTLYISLVSFCKDPTDDHREHFMRVFRDNVGHKLIAPFFALMNLFRCSNEIERSAKIKRFFCESNKIISNFNTISESKPELTESLFPKAFWVEIHNQVVEMINEDTLPKLEGQELWSLMALKDAHGTSGFFHITSLIDCYMNEYQRQNKVDG